MRSIKLIHNREYVVSGPEIHFSHRSWSAFQFCGCVGLTLGVAINVGLGARLNLPFRTSVFVALLGLFMIPVVAIVAKIISGEEQLCFYHHLIAVLAVTAIVLRLLGQPILPFLDVLILAIGMARAVGYLGCLMAGCCHGRPSPWGVVYGEQYVEAVPRELLGVRLFPIQVIEALWTLVVVVVGCILIFAQPVAGAGVGWFIATYCPARFCFEFARWPPNYQFRSGLSQHQWISVVLVLFVVALEFLGVLPFQSWHPVIFTVLLLITALVVIERQLRSVNKQLNHSEHIRELSTAIDLAARRFEIRTSPNSAIEIARTSLGLQVSAEKILCGNADVYHFALSCRSGLSEVTANSLAKTIVRLQNLPGPFEVIPGNSGVFHLLVHSTRREAS